MTGGGNSTKPTVGYNLTPRQRELLRFLVSRDACPNYEEMRVALGLASKSGVSRMINALERKGYVTRVPHSPYSLSVRRLPADAPTPIVVGRQPEVIYLPLHGRID